MPDPTAHESVTTILVTTSLAAAGWIAAYFLTGLREDRTKRLQQTTKHSSNQIKEFYAPLMALTDQLDSLVKVKDAVVRGKSHEEHRELDSLFYKHFFSPIHEQINSILKTKIHLSEGATMPASFLKYFEHYATEKAYWDLLDSNKDVSNIKVPKYPSDFYYDIRDGYDVVNARYEASLDELRHKAAFPSFSNALSNLFSHYRSASARRRKPTCEMD